ncbi:MAG: EAL domain-containing protein, partial [Erysipelotrichaceae bacterium]|nr:EAL domain-containing protein [Erysipelotrichaceae bacterium]
KEQKDIEFINVNLSPAQCLNSMLSSELSAIAAKYDVSMNMIDFEITETAAEDFLSIQKQIYLLQKEGAELSLDDFGAGTSNLTRLMNLPIHVVKIDMEVAQSYFKEEVSFLPDLIRMFQNANMKIVVEGVETEEMKNMLMSLDCDYLQGFYFSKALPEDEFIAFMEENKNKKW